MATLQNKALLEKADLALSDLTSGGLLVAQQAANFLRITIKQAKVLPLISVQTMSGPTAEIDKLYFPTRILHAAKPQVALSSNQRAKPTLGKVTLTTHLFKAEIRLGNEVLEDQIERGGLVNTVMETASGAVARDMDEIVIQGDTTSADPDLAELDGIVKQAASNVVAAGGVSLDKNTLRDMQKTMPSEFMDRSRMLYLVSNQAEIDYRDSVANRATDVGDQALGAYAASLNNINYNGMKVIDVPMFPENLGSGNDESYALLLDPKNIVLGFQRKITMETDKDITASELIIVTSVRFDVKYAHEPAVVKATGIKVG
jgi:HK97 family phage major capsid protein